MQYQTPVISDFGSIAAHTFIGQKNTIGPGHVDKHGECSDLADGSSNTSYPRPCTGKEPKGTFD